jgi:hypothetical protein
VNTTGAAFVKNSSRAPLDLRSQAIAEHHDLLAQDRELTSFALDRMRAAMRAQRLTYGTRPIGVALRPHFLDRAQFDSLTTRAELIAAALEKVAAAALESRTVMTQLGLSEMEQRLARVDPGFSGASINTRIDGFVYGHEIKFVEYNAENPSSLSDQEGLNRVLFELPAMSTFRQRYKLEEFSPARKLFETLLEVYREWGETTKPKIAIVDWKNLPTSNEFVLLREYFAAHGVDTIICSPDELEYNGRKLSCGEFEIDLVYKRVLIHEFLAKYDETHPLVRAYANHDVCLVNPFRCKLTHKKASFEFLTDEARQKWFSVKENEAIERSVPWTRRLTNRRTTYHGRTIELIKFVRQNRSRFVLKPNDDYGGRGVFIGPRVEEREWENAITLALSHDYVVQEAIELREEEFPIINERDWQVQPMFVDTNPFLFRGRVCGAMVRLSTSPVVNVTSGGGETGFFVIDAARNAPVTSRTKKWSTNAK